MDLPRVYLAGPMGGLTVTQARGWRTFVAERLQERGIYVLNPMRDEYASVDEVISTDYRHYKDRGTFFTPQSIVARDFNDVKQSGCLLINFLGAKVVSIGTVMELAWSFALQRPVVVCIESEGNPHDQHPMLHSVMPFRVETLDEGIEAVVTILGGR